MKVEMNLPSGQWNASKYPVQSPSRSTSVSTATVPHIAPLAEDAPIRFPSVIKAAKDSRGSDTSRTLIICLDGTGDQFDDDNSNVVNLVKCLKKDDPRQVTYYQSGIGTYNEDGLRNGISAVVDMSVGSGLGVHIKDAYCFLMENYREGDKICLFGFSRGSYTVRCLAGMLHKVGLLPPHNRAQVNFAYNFYKNDTAEGWRMSADFKNTFCADVNVYFVGVWDCVASVGFFPRKLPFSKSPTNNIGFFRHAMALDEHRAKFKICQYANDDPAALTKATKHFYQIRADAPFKSRAFFKRHSKSEPETNNKTYKRQKDLGFTNTEPLYSITAKDSKELQNPTRSIVKGVSERKPTDVLEVWFLGGHSDVGGGSVKNWERHVLARVPLRWMIRQCFECNTGILFKTVALAESGIDIHTIWPIYKMPKRPVVGPSPEELNKYAADKIPPIQRRSTSLALDLNKNDCQSEIASEKLATENIQMNEQDEMLPEQTEDYFDSMAPINDQLRLAKGWWILEFWPVKIRRQKLDSDEWEKVVRFNLGSYRAIRELEPKMHWTVEQRILDKNYKIKARVDRQAHWKIVA